MIYQSTKALSVYNALSLTGQDMPRGQVDAFLRGTFDQNLPEDYVEHGVEYLVSHGLAFEIDGVLTIERLPSGRGKPVLRCNNDQDLMSESR
jgi:hypothetical protein